MLAMPKTVQTVPWESPADRRRVSGPGLRTFVNIADEWRLTEKQRMSVLGSPGRSTYYGWLKRAQDGEDVVLPVDTLLRISAILGVYKALGILFPKKAEAGSWMTSPNAGLPFAGRAPIDLVTTGTQQGIIDLRRYLDAWRGGSLDGLGGTPVSDIEPITEEDVVFL